MRLRVRVRVRELGVRVRNVKNRLVILFVIHHNACVRTCRLSTNVSTYTPPNSPRPSRPLAPSVLRYQRQRDGTSPEQTKKECMRDLSCI